MPDLKKYTVIVDSAVNKRMTDHFEFLARVSEDAAYRLFDTFIADIKSLEIMPEINPFFERPYLPHGKYRYALSAGRYRIVFQIESDTVYVDDIQDCRQDDDKNLV